MGFSLFCGKFSSFPVKTLKLIWVYNLYIVQGYKITTKTPSTAYEWNMYVHKNTPLQVCIELKTVLSFFIVLS